MNCMKKINLIFLFFTIVVFSKNSTALTCSIAGAIDVCPGSTIVYHTNYVTNKLITERVEKIQWTCGSDGRFSNGSTMIENIGSVPNNPTYQAVTWNNINGSSS